MKPPLWRTPAQKPCIPVRFCRLRNKPSWFEITAFMKLSCSAGRQCGLSSRGQSCWPGPGHRNLAGLARASVPSWRVDRGWPVRPRWLGPGRPGQPGRACVEWPAGAGPPTSHLRVLGLAGNAPLAAAPVGRTLLPSWVHGDSHSHAPCGPELAGAAWAAGHLAVSLRLPRAQPRQGHMPSGKRHRSLRAPLSTDSGSCWGRNLSRSGLAPGPAVPAGPARLSPLARRRACSSGGVCAPRP